VAGHPVGTIELYIRQLRSGSNLQSLLELRLCHERALRSVVQEAYVITYDVGPPLARPTLIWPWTTS
jgi:hypothetical protein